jgi:SAM-dependent methyltransferase
MTDAITTRYGALAESTCCLSCGSAIGHVAARAGQRCLDLGCGRGNDVLRMAERVGETGHAYGVDITDSMLEKARYTAKKLGVTNVSFLKADLAALPLGDAEVDWVTSNCVLNHANDKAAVWREIARVLRLGGRFVVSDIYAIVPIPEQYRSDPEAVAECWAGAILKSEYLEAIAQAGLTDVTILEESAPYLKGKVEVASFTISGIRPGSASPTPLRQQTKCCS